MEAKKIFKTGWKVVLGLIFTLVIVSALKAIETMTLNIISDIIFIPVYFIVFFVLWKYAL